MHSELGEDVSTLADLNSEFIFSVVIYCLKHIDDSVDYPKSLPRNMAGRVSLATQVCATLKVCCISKRRT
jgi:CCDC22 protein N-terminal domain